jgi:prepilin peptidase CpaA
VPPLKPLLFGLLAVVLVISVVTDLRSRRILDLITWPAMASALGLRLAMEGVGALEQGLTAGLAGLAIAGGGFAAFALWSRGLGWGDVKLAAAVGAALGYPLVVSALLATSVAGAIQAIMSLLWQGALSDTVRRLLGRGGGGEREGPTRHIPYGVAIALGSFWAMWWDVNAS